MFVLEQVFQKKRKNTNAISGGVVSKKRSTACLRTHQQKSAPVIKKSEWKPGAPVVSSRPKHHYFWEKTFTPPIRPLKLAIAAMRQETSVEEGLKMHPRTPGGWQLRRQGGMTCCCNETCLSRNIICITSFAAPKSIKGTPYKSRITHL